MTHGLPKPHRSFDQMGRHGYPKSPRDRKLAALSIVVILALAGLVAWWSDPARSQTQYIPRCSTHAAMLLTLERGWQEKIVERHVIPDGWAIEVLASPSGSWTRIAINPGDGTACILEIGTGWVKPLGKDT